MFSRTLRFLFALPVALVVTVGLYYLTFPRPIFEGCYDCAPGSIVAERPPAWSGMVEKIRTYCDCFWWIPDQPDNSNSYTRRDKASPEPPEPVACIDDCDVSRIEIPDDVLLKAPFSEQHLLRERFRPQYPKACIDKGADGVVVVEFDVTPEGSVDNPRIISSPDACFNREALRTVSRYHYQPQTDASGRAVWRRGVRETMVFEIEG